MRESQNPGCTVSLGRTGRRESRTEVWRPRRSPGPHGEPRRLRPLSLPTSSAPPPQPVLPLTPRLRLSHAAMLTRSRTQSSRPRATPRRGPSGAGDRTPARRSPPRRTRAGPEGAEPREGDRRGRARRGRSVGGGDPGGWLRAQRGPTPPRPRGLACAVRATLRLDSRRPRAHARPDGWSPKSLRSYPLVHRV